MQPLISAMSINTREVFVAAIKSLLKGKSFIQALIAFWISPTSTKAQNAETGRSPLRSIADFLKEAESSLLGPNEGGTEAVRRAS